MRRRLEPIPKVLVRVGPDGRGIGGRPRIRPESKMVAFNCPLELLERIEENAHRKTADNRSMMICNVLEGLMTLD